jgi:hypothetical protein
MVLFGIICAYSQTVSTTSSNTNVAVTVVTGDASSIASTSAVLNGTINLTGNVAAAWFEWGTTTSLGTRTTPQVFQDGTGARTFTSTLTSLKPNTTYYFRAVGYQPVAGVPNALGDIKSFTTSDGGSNTNSTNASLTITTLDATSIGSNAAVLNGSVNPAGGASLWFEWGTTTALGTRTDVQKFDGTATISFNQSLGSLQPKTTYYFRAVAYNATTGAAGVGEVKTFTTLESTSTTNNSSTTGSTTPVTVVTNDATSITPTSGVLNGTINLSGSAAAAWFEWGTTTSLGTRTDSQVFQDAKGAKAFTATLTNLKPGTTYYFRAVGYPSVAGAANALGDIKTFTTLQNPSTTTTDTVSTTAPQKIPEVEDGQIKSGYVVITPDSGSAAPIPTLTFGLVSNGLVQSQAAVIPSPLTTDASMYVEVIPSINRNIGVAIVNPGDTVNAVALTLRDEDGNLVGTPVNISIAGHAQVSKFLNELFSADVIGKGIRGSIRLQASAPFGVVGFRFSGSLFSTVAVAVTATVAGVPAMTLNPGTTTNTPMPGTIGGANAVLIPQFALSGGWASQIALVNNANAVMSGRIDVFDAAGNPMAVKLNGQSQSTFTYSIGVGGTFILAPRDSNGQSPL